jgi:hypothetical protein
VNGVSSDCCCNTRFLPMTTSAFAVRISFRHRRAGVGSQVQLLRLICAKKLFRTSPVRLPIKLQSPSDT